MARRNRTLLVARREFRTTVARPGFIIFTALVPFAALLGLIALTVVQAIRQDRPPEQRVVGYVDLTAGPDGEGLFTGFRDQGATTFEPFSSQREGVEALLADDIGVLYIIAPDYLETGNVLQVTRESQGIPIDGGPATGTPLARFLLDNILADIDSNRSERVFTPVVLSTLQIDETGAPAEPATDFGTLVILGAFALLLLTSVFTTAGYLLQGLSQEKEYRIMEVLLSSLRPENLMAGKLIGLGAAGLTQMAVWTASAIGALAVLGTRVDLPFEVAVPPAAIVVGLLYFLLGYAFFATLMGALGAVTPTEREANQITVIVVLPAIVPLWLIMPLLGNPNGALARILSYLPWTSPTAALIRYGSGAMSLPELALSLGILAMAVAIAIFVTLRLFRAYLLMFGQRPSIRQIVATLRAA